MGAYQSLVVANIYFAEQEAVTFATYVSEQMEKLRPKNVTWEAELTGIPAFLPLMQSRFGSHSFGD